MNDDRTGALALFAAVLGILVTMSLHPEGHHLLEPGEERAAMLRNVLAHSLGLASLPFSFLGALALTRRLDAPERLALVALVLHGFALVAGMIAAAVSGLVTPQLVPEMLAAEPASRELGLALFHFSAHLNQAFAWLLVIGASAAIGLWSWAILQGRALARGTGLYGVVLAPLTVFALLTGHVRLDVHGFGLIVLAQSIWYVAAGVGLLRAGRAVGARS